MSRRSTGGGSSQASAKYCVRCEGRCRYGVAEELIPQSAWLFPNQNPVGKHIIVQGAQGEPVALPIIGVIADIKDLGLAGQIEPEIYWPGTGREAVLLVRTFVNPMSLASAVRQAVLSIDHVQPVYQARSVEEILSTSLTARRFSVRLVGALALVSLLLAAIGIYGVVSYSVTERTQEIGIRMALGAQAGDVLRLVISRGLLPVLLGVGLGLDGAWVLSRLMMSLTTNLLFEVDASDPPTFTVIALLLLLVALVACLVPARRATKVDPLVALRYE